MGGEEKLLRGDRLELRGQWLTQSNKSFIIKEKKKKERERIIM